MLTIPALKRLIWQGNIMRKCKVCGLGDIEYDNDFCKVCGWEADTIQEENPNYVGGANIMTFNQYKKFWIENKNEILKSKDEFFVMELKLEYYEKNFQDQNEEILRKEGAGEIEKEIK